MKHQDITQMVNSMKIRDLTEGTFEEFVQSANGLFVPEGVKFQEYFSQGYNTLSKDGFDWSKGKPEYRKSSLLAFKRIESRQIIPEGKKWINVYFQNLDHDFEEPGVWGLDPKRLPLRFAFNPGRALYIAEQEGSGTPEKPWETLYLKLD